MKIEIPEDMQDEIAKDWLEWVVSMSNIEHKHPDDSGFWIEMGWHATRILNLNWANEELDD